MSDVAQAFTNEQERWREHRRNQSNDDGFGIDKDELPASFDADTTDMSDTQLVIQNKELLEMQKEADYQNNSTVATDIAKRRMELWNEAKERGISDEFE